MSQGQSRSWCFTLNNYKEEDVERLSNLGDKVEYLIFGREVAESGTPHLQGLIVFRAKRRFQTVKNCLGSESVHVERCNSVPASIVYCKKQGDYVEVGCPPRSSGCRDELELFKKSVNEGTLDMATLRELHSNVCARYPHFVRSYVFDKAKKVEVPMFPLRPWQQELYELLKREPDSRTIIFLVDPVGNTGKSWFSHYYCKTNDNAQVLLPGKKADMAFALEIGLRVLFIDAPRSKQAEYIQYDFLEDVKNGFVFSTKYESRIKTFSNVHVVVNMNEDPDYTKLSEDRYKVIKVSL